MNYDTDEITLLHGIKDKNNRNIQTVYLKALDGYDEDFLNMIVDKVLPYPIKTNYLLSRFIRIPPNYKCSEMGSLDDVRNMTIGDRAYLAFLIRRLMYGNSIYFNVPCGSCQNSMSIHLLINQILTHTLTAQDSLNVTISKITGNYQLNYMDSVIEFRLLNGLDQEKLFMNNINEIEVLKSCIQNMDSILQKKLDDTNLSNLLSSTLSQLDPLSDIVLTQDCPSCNEPTKIPFIIEDYLFKEIRSRKNNLEWEVHWLALNYHWSESEILKLPIAKRRRYVELVNSTFGGEVTIG